MSKRKESSTGTAVPQAAEEQAKAGRAERRCPCCGEPVKGKGEFAGMGHDAKYKSQLVNAAVAGSAEAEQALAARGWTKFLDKRREVLAREEARRAKGARCGRCQRLLTDPQSIAAGYGPECIGLVGQEGAAPAA